MNHNGHKGHKKDKKEPRMEHGLKGHAFCVSRSLAGNERETQAVINFWFFSVFHPWLLFVFFVSFVSVVVHLFSQSRPP
jgi:hypothetical protein